MGDKIDLANKLAWALPSVPFWRPVKLVAGITNACNLKCTMCWRTVNKPKAQHMDWRVFQKILEIKPRSIAFMGEGESLLNPNISDFAYLCRLKKIGVYMTTNGMIFSDALVEASIKEVLFSIDGVRESYERIRVGAKFETVIRHLTGFSSMREGRKPKVSVNFVGMKSNIEDLPELIETVSGYADSIMLVHPTIMAHDQVNEHLHQNKELAERVFKESISVAKKHHVKLILRSLEPYTSGCVIPWFAPYIGITGNVYPCCSIGMNDGQETSTQYNFDTPVSYKVSDYLMGNIMESSFKDIWKGDKFKFFREELKRINCGKDSELYCDVCPVRWNCAC